MQESHSASDTPPLTSGLLMINPVLWRVKEILTGTGVLASSQFRIRLSAMESIGLFRDFVPVITLVS